MDYAFSIVWECSPLDHELELCSQYVSAEGMAPSTGGQAAASFLSEGISTGITKLANSHKRTIIGFSLVSDFWSHHALSLSYDGIYQIVKPSSTLIKYRYHASWPPELWAK